MKKTRSNEGIAALQIASLVLVATMPAIAAPIVASSSDAFVDSMGVNVKLSYDWSSYNNYSGLVKPELLKAGFRHIRDGFSTSGPFQTSVNEFNDLAANGIKTDLICDPGCESGTHSTDAQGIVNTLNQISGAVESVEGVNEPDNFSFSYNGLPWDQSSKAWQQVLYGAVKNSGYSYLPVIAPSLGNPLLAQNNTYLDSLEPYCNLGNMHSYQSADYPGNNDYTNLQNFYIGNTELMTGSEPIWATETGNWIGTAFDGSFWMAPITESSQAKYALRTFAVNFLAGVPRTYVHELIDESTDPTYWQGNFGLLTWTGVEKPAFTQIANIISLLKDPGSSYAPGVLDYSLSGNTANVDQLLLEKQNGTFELLLWQEVKSYNNSNPLGDITVAPVSVTVNFGSTINQAKLYDPSTGTSPVTTYPANQTQITLNVPDRIVILQLSYNGPLPNGKYTLAPNSVPGSRLTAPSSANGVQMQVDPAAANGGQYWYITNMGNGYYKVQLSYNLGCCLDVSGAGNVNMTPVDIWTDNGTSAQRWALTATGSAYNFTPQCAQSQNEMLSVQGYNGTTAQLWQMDGIADEQWVPGRS
jgi:hypothetical protein